MSSDSSTASPATRGVALLARVLRLQPEDAATLYTKLTDPEVGTNFDATLLQALGRAIRGSLPGRRTPPARQARSWVVMPATVPDATAVQAYLAGHGQPEESLAGHCAHSLAPRLAHLGQTLLHCLYWCGQYVRADRASRRLLRATLPHAVAARRLAQQAAAHSVQRIILWGHLYSPFQMLMAQYARAAGIHTLACESGVIYAPRLAMAADEIWLPQPWGVRAAVEAGHYRARTLRIAHSHDYYRPRPRTEVPADRVHRIAFYSSGAYVRQMYSFDSPDFLSQFREAESRILSALLHYARARPDLHFTVKLHPIEKKAEHRAAVELHFADAMALPNIEVSRDPAPSRDSYAHYELGLGYLSTTLYERLELGLKSLFLYARGYPSAPVHSMLRHAMCDETDPQRLQAWLESMRLMPLTEYHARIGAPASWLAGQLSLPEVAA